MITAAIIVASIFAYLTIGFGITVYWYTVIDGISIKSYWDTPGPMIFSFLWPLGLAAIPYFVAKFVVYKLTMQKSTLPEARVLKSDGQGF